jgi:hypothetical protein
MQNIFDIFAIIFFLISLTLTVVMGIGWLTCTNYYFKIIKTTDSFLVYMFTLFSTVTSTSTLVAYFFTGDLLIPPIYLNLGIWILIIVSYLVFGICVALFKCREFFARKRGIRL